jgi:hypothetical protein
MPAEPDLSAIREALAMAGYHNGRVQSSAMQATILLSAYEGTIADDEVPLCPPGDPAWFQQAVTVLEQADQECARLKVQLLTAQLRILQLMLAGKPDLELSRFIDILVPDTETHQETPMTTGPAPKLLDRVRKLLAKAEAEGVTPPEAEALTAKAAELMARYGIDRARLGAHSQQDRPGNRIIDIDNPWAQVRAHLLAGLAGAMNCQCVLLSTSKPGARIHVFGYASDLERADIMYTSLLLQMASALRKTAVPIGVRSVRAWRRSFLLGFVTAVILRVKSAEERARGVAKTEDYGKDGPSTALVLADRAVVIRTQLQQAYPTTRRTRITYSGRGYSSGYAQGQRADIGQSGLKSTRALGRG